MLRSWLRDRVRRHVDETGSAVGQRLLDQWKHSATQFVKIMPKDYKRVLAAQRQAELDGTDPVKAVMAAAG